MFIIENREKMTPFFDHYKDVKGATILKERDFEDAILLCNFFTLLHDLMTHFSQKKLLSSDLLPYMLKCEDLFNGPLRTLNLRYPMIDFTKLDEFMLKMWTFQKNRMWGTLSFRSLPSIWELNPKKIRKNIFYNDPPTIELITQRLLKVFEEEYKKEIADFLYDFFTLELVSLKQRGLFSNLNEKMHGKSLKDILLIRTDFRKKKYLNFLKTMTKEESTYLYVSF